MKIRFYKIYPICLVLFLMVSCSRAPRPIQTQAIQEVKKDSEIKQASSFQNTSTTTQQAENPYVNLEEHYIKEGHRNYKDYEISLRKKEVRVEDSSRLSPVSYVVVKKGDRVVATFDQLRYSLGTFARFALFKLTGDDDPQVIAEQTINRGWGYWIATLSPKFQLLFNSTKYDVYGELSPIDVDKDGTHEFVMALTTFWFFDGLCGACSPRIRIIFKFDKSAKEYYPANHLFSDFVLKDIADDISQVGTAKSKPEKEGGDQHSIYAAVLRVVVEYLYAGKEKEAWDFFDREYNYPDKQTRKARITGTLRKDSVYKVIRQKK